ncbi:MAG: DUF4397 domain-containing protein [Pseudomonadota bacterium]|nr:DUF4397 domain-containing protein [Pseudomonadota bacterium]
MRKNWLAAALLTGGLSLGGCDLDDDKYYKWLPSGELRVIHASPDAPPVNVLINGRTRIEGLDYGDASPYAPLLVGNYHIAVEGIIPGGNSTVIEVGAFPITKNAMPTVLAVNNVSAIEPLVITPSAAHPGADEVALVVTHGAPVAGPVDVYVTAPGADISGASPAFTFDFKDSIDVGALPVGTVELQVAVSDTLVYNSGPVDLSAFAGQRLMLVAINSENATEQAAAPIKLLAVTQDTSLALLDADTLAGARVVHASPDAGAAAGGPVEVFAASPALGADPVEVIDGFAYTDIVPAADSYISIPAGDYEFSVAPDTDSIGDAVFTSPALGLSAGTEYTVMAAGRVTSTPAFGLLASVDDNRPIATQVSLKVTHGAPAAGVVDVYVTAAGEFSAAEVVAGMAGAPVLADFAFGTTTDYLALSAGDYDIRVVAGGAAAINLEGLSFTGGQVLHAIARGPAEPAGSPADFGVILLSN